ncbi:MAG: S-adenosylmethionine:tRNA ribosyltransferase-isomerase [Chitinophagales bacterium]|nr:S-adenosylmethionine:tRNA ribosyltransferase-isomerase [Chitinophagales bacterium]
MHPKNLFIADFTYTLPYEKIAQHLLAQRDQSRMLVYEDGKVTDTAFGDIAEHLPGNSTIIFNDTKVIHARIIFENEHHAAIEVFLLEPAEPFHDMQLAMFQHGACTWRCLVGNAKKWREKKLVKKISIDGRNGLLEVKQAGKAGDDFLIHFSWTPEEISFAKILEATGFVPLPPYIKRTAAGDDEERYQTIYAIQDGSVAAPTAGLHFSNTVFEALEQKNIQRLFVTLHVGAGTFKPVKEMQIRDHPMHAEQMIVHKETLEQLIARLDEPIIAVGTTSCRTLESMYWLGKMILDGAEDFQIAQWAPYEEVMASDEAINTSSITAKQSLMAILQYLQRHKLNQLTASTKLIIAPGYTFKIVDGLITNFHLPNSTLLLLVAAFIGDDWRMVYDYALAHNFRFLSYGDGSLLWSKRSHT